ncbi:MAG: class I SAM-dependent methyltransferase [Terriglobia bacterium]
MSNSSDRKFKVLDLFCGAGGSAMGLHRAWPDAEIVGVDIKPQPRYPFTFIEADAMTFPLEGYDFNSAPPSIRVLIPMFVDI